MRCSEVAGLHGPASRELRASFTLARLTRSWREARAKLPWGVSKLLPSFAGAKLSGCDFSNCDLTDALFDAATGFAGGKFIWGRLPAGLDLRGKSLNQATPLAEFTNQKYKHF